MQIMVDGNTRGLLNTPGAPEIVPTAGEGVLLHLQQIAGTSPRIRLDGFGAGGDPLVEGRHPEGTAAAPTATVINRSLLGLRGEGHDGTAYSSNSPALINILASENWNSTSHGTEIQFAVTPNGTTANIEAFRILNSGLVDFNYDIYAGDWTNYSPTVASATGSITTYTSSGRYKKFNKICFFHATANIANNGTGATYVNISLPIVTTSNSMALVAGINTTTGLMLQGHIVASSGNIAVLRYDNAYPLGVSGVIVISGSYEVA